MESVLDRIEEKINDWKKRETRFEKMFGAETVKSRPFLKEKLAHFEGLYIELQKNRPLVYEDKMVMVAINVERNKLEKKLHPGLWNRLFVKIIKSFVLGKLIKKEQDLILANYGAVKEDMERSGLGRYYEQAEAKMKQGNREISLPVSYFINERERMDLQINLSKDLLGQYHLESFKVKVTDERMSKVSKQQVFLPGSVISLGQAINQLSGRSILKQEGYWQSLDFNDRDANGNFRFKNFPRELGFDLEKNLQNLPILYKAKTEELRTIKERLEMGDLVEVNLVKNGKQHEVSITANPQKKEIQLLDKEGLPVIISDLGKGNKANMKMVSRDLHADEPKVVRINKKATRI